MEFYQRGPRERRLRDRHPAGAGAHPRRSAVPLPLRRGAGDRRGRRRPIASATSSWRRGCRSSSGAASRTTSCWTWRRKGRLRDPQVLEQQVRRMLADPKADALDRRTSPASGCTCASWRTCRPTRSELRRQPAPGVPPRDRDAVLDASSARIAASSICSTPTTRSSTSGWRATTASRTSTAATSAA